MMPDYIDGSKMGRAPERALKDTAVEAEGTQEREIFAEEMGLSDTYGRSQSSLLRGSVERRSDKPALNKKDLFMHCVTIRRPTD